MISVVLVTITDEISFLCGVCGVFKAKSHETSIEARCAGDFVVSIRAFSRNSLAHLDSIEISGDLGLKTPHKTDIVSVIVAKSDEIGENGKKNWYFVQKLDLILLCGVHKRSLVRFHMKRELRFD